MTDTARAANANGTDEKLTELLCDPFTTYGEASVIANAYAVVAPPSEDSENVVTSPSGTRRSGRPTTRRATHAPNQRVTSA